MNEIANEMGIRTWMLWALIVQAVVLIFPVPALIILIAVLRLPYDVYLACKKILVKLFA